MTSIPTVRLSANNIQIVGDQISGYIFMCSSLTKPDCFMYRVFGLPASKIEVVEKIKPNTNLFLFDFDLRLLYGMYAADSCGKLAIEPYAFGGKFPAQVKFSILRHCLPLPEVAFKDVIKENYYSGSKFKQDLSAEQVNKLVALFRPINTPLPVSQWESPLVHNALESLHPGYRGSTLQITKLPSHGHVAGSGLRNIQLHSSLSHFQDAPLQPSHLAHHQMVPARNDRLISHFDGAHSPQAYHPDQPGLHLHDVHARNVYMQLNSSSTVVPQVISANNYYGTSSMPQSNVSLQLSLQQPKPLISPPTVLSSSSTASQWVAVASAGQTPGGRTSSLTIPCAGDPNASYGSNITTMAHQYPNEGYPGYYQEPSVPSSPGHAYDPNSASLGSYYRENYSDPALAPTLISSTHGGAAVDQTHIYTSTNSTLASGHQYTQYQGYLSSLQTPSQTTYQPVNSVSKTYPSYWTTAPSSRMTEHHQVSQAVVPGVSAHSMSGYVPTYSSGANRTY